MNAGHRSARQIASKSGWSSDSICRSCRQNISRARYSTTASAIAEQSLSTPLVPPATQAASPQIIHQVRAGVVLSRPPLITRDLHPFEKAYFLYQRRLNERLALPFTKYFYFKKGSPADIEWKRKIKDRLTPARDIGVYNAYGKEGWNDELLVGAPESEPEHQVEALLKDVEVPAIDAGEMGQAARQEPIERPLPRVTEADRQGDKKSLNRLIQHSLYLLVQDEKGRWVFPSDRVIGRESLHEAAERLLGQAAGANMNTWVVGNAPVGHLSARYEKPVVDKGTGMEEIGERIFFMKARIMAGQADLKANPYGLRDFKWLAKEEIHQIVLPEYWKAVRNMLTLR